MPVCVLSLDALRWLPPNMPDNGAAAVNGLPFRVVEDGPNKTPLHVRALLNGFGQCSKYSPYAGECGLSHSRILFHQTGQAWPMRFHSCTWPGCHDHPRERPSPFQTLGVNTPVHFSCSPSPALKRELGVLQSIRQEATRSVL